MKIKIMIISDCFQYPLNMILGDKWNLGGEKTTFRPNHPREIQFDSKFETKFLVEFY